MEQVKPAVRPLEQPKPKTPSWGQMTTNQRVIYAVKVALCVVSFGFIFPDIANE